MQNILTTCLRACPNLYSPLSYKSINESRRFMVEIANRYLWPALDLKNEDNESAVTVTLPTTNTLLNVPSRDLLLRLLDIDPKRRLRSTRKLETIAFYKGYNIEDARKIRAKELLVKHFGENYNKPSDDLHVFDGFDEIFIDE
ncbi:hypothetical protein GWI33_016368 [Rhynchophorus ferrugineus]|uniref:Uncharacterized protein n=1 Tax=Rhynchophorus ferrugineus TaxID=354439 RepID=A0A834I3Q1_RHYFE|nr:hypothetical protein GWI33_016368 [Rhynchophorus ferrugineus]